MSPLARAVGDKFEAVYGSELARLRRRTASLSAADRAAVEAASAQVMQAFSASIQVMLESCPDADVELVVRRIFALEPPEAADAAHREAPAPAEVRTVKL